MRYAQPKPDRAAPDGAETVIIGCFGVAGRDEDRSRGKEKRCLDGVSGSCQTRQLFRRSQWELPPEGTGLQPGPEPARVAPAGPGEWPKGAGGPPVAQHGGRPR